MNKNVLSVMLLLLSINYLAVSQRVKFGKIDKELLEKQYSEIDSSAAAEIIYDRGETSINSNSFNSFFRRHTVIKVYDKDRYDDDLNIGIGIYGNARVQGLKCITYNLENGSVEEVELEKSQIYTEEITNYYKQIRFAVPAVLNGSVIEYKYEISDGSRINVRDWFFQSKYPTVYSEYSANFPEGLMFSRNARGYADVMVEKDPDYELFIAENIPAFVEEPYSVNTNEYYTSIKYELTSINIGGINYEFSESWSDIDKSLRESSNFLAKINTKGIIKKTLEEIYSDEITDKEKLQQIYEYVQQNTNWSERNTMMSSKPYKDILGGELSGAADINFLLISLMRAAGFNAYPVVLSTRGNGVLYEHNPSREKLNYVVAAVTTAEDTLFLDATDDDLTFGMLPKRTLNGMARAISENQAYNFQLIPNQKYRKIAMAQLAVSENKITVNQTVTQYGYAALEARKTVKKEGDEDVLLKEGGFEGELDTELEVKNLKDLTKPVELSYAYSSDRYVTQAGNMLLITPLLNFAETENPFKLKERKYPIDFAYPIDETVIMQYTVPEGWTLSERPENVRLVLPGRAGSYTFSLQQVGQNIQVMRSMKINKPVFYYNEYAALKNFFDIIAQKEAEKIVLTKN